VKGSSVTRLRRAVTAATVNVAGIPFEQAFTVDILYTTNNEITADYQEKYFIRKLQALKRKL
jgi:hypothetical protein